MTIEADSVLMAAGQRVDLSFLKEELDIARNRGLIKVEDESQKTSRPNFFAGGDVVTGPTLSKVSVPEEMQQRQSTGNWVLKIHRNIIRKVSLDLQQTVQRKRQQ